MVEVADLIVVAVVVVELLHFQLLLLLLLRQRWSCDCPSGGEVGVHPTLVVIVVLVVVVDFAGPTQALVGQPLADKVAVEERLTLERLHQLVDRLRNLADMLHCCCCYCC